MYVRIFNPGGSLGLVFPQTATEQTSRMHLRRSLKRSLAPINTDGGVRSCLLSTLPPPARYREASIIIVIVASYVGIFLEVELKTFKLFIHTWNSDVLYRNTSVSSPDSFFRHSWSICHPYYLMNTFFCLKRLKKSRRAKRKKNISGCRHAYSVYDSQWVSDWSITGGACIIREGA